MKCEEEPSNVLWLQMGKAMDEVEDDVMVKVWVTSGYYIGEMYMRILKTREGVGELLNLLVPFVSYGTLQLQCQWSILNCLRF